jgi:PAS domain S-box-containing protein
MEKLNERLAHQLQQYLGTNKDVPPGLAEFLRTVSNTYNENERTQQKINDLQQHQSMLEELNDQGSWVYYFGITSNPEHSHWEVSPASLRILGFDERTPNISKEDFFSHVHPDDRTSVEKAFLQSLATYAVFDIAHRVVLPEGHIKVVHLWGRMVYNDQGQPTKIVGVVKDLTSKRAAEQLLQHANDELTRLFNSINEVFFSFDVVANKIVQISAACEKVYGHTQQQFLDDGMLGFDMVLDEDKHILLSNMTLLALGQEVIEEFRIRHADGSIRWLESRLEPTLDAEGRLLCIDGVTNDITKRKVAEIAVKESEIKFRSLIEYNSEAIMVVTLDNTIKYVGGSIYRMSGFTAEEVVSMPCDFFVHPDDLHLVAEMMRNLTEQPDVQQTITYRRKKKDGSYIWCEGVATSMLHIPGVEGVVINVKDITERVMAENALRHSEHKYHSLMVNSSDAITLINDKFEVVFASDSMLTITGFAPQEVSGKTYVDFVHPEDREIADQYFAQVMEQPSIPHKLLYRSRKKNGTYFWCDRVTVNWLHDPVINGIVSNYRDVSDRKAYTFALEQANAELKKSNMELDRFVYSVSHDLRSPLVSMLGVIGIIEQEHSGEEVMNDIGLLKSSIQKLDKFILSILEYSKNSRREAKTVPIDFPAIINGALDNLRYIQNSGNIDIRVNVDPAVRLHSDPERIGIILNNLLANALRYYNCKTTNPYVHIAVQPQGGHTHISVSDNGIGIAADKHEKVFEMFYRLSADSTGSGLGLYIVKETVQKLNGSISLQSELNEGSRFTIVLPNLEN